MSGKKPVTRSQAKSVAFEIKVTDDETEFDAFKPKLQSTVVATNSPFSRAPRLTRSPPRFEETADEEAPEAISEEDTPEEEETVVVPEKREVQELAIVKQDRAEKIIDDLRVNMGDVTMLEATAAGRAAATPKFISPPIFNPITGNANTFMENYERTAAANGWNNGHKINFLGTFLEGPAHTWHTKYTEIAANATKKWSAIKNDFCQEFGGAQSRAKLDFRFNAKNQTGDEDIKHYYYELLSLANEADPDMPFERFRAKFEGGLHASMYRDYFHAAYNLVNMEELKELVFRLNSVQEKLDLVDPQSRQWNRPRDQHNGGQNGGYRRPYNNRRGNNGGSYRNQNRNSSNEGQRENRRNQNREANTGQNKRNEDRQDSNREGNNQSNDTRTTENKPRCFNCDKVGHYARDCYSRPRGEQQARGNNRNNNRRNRPSDNPNGTGRQD